MNTTDVRIEAERPEQAHAIRTVVQAAFVNEPKVADLVEALRASTSYVPELALVALAGDEVVGFVMLSHAETVEENGTAHRVLSLSPLAVAPDRQRQGVGGLLVRRALELADQRTEPLVLLEGAPEYYPRFGFRPASSAGIVFDLPDWAPPEAGMLYRLARYDPSIRGRVRYPPAFRVLEG